MSTEIRLAILVLQVSLTSSADTGRVPAIDRVPSRQTLDFLLVLRAFAGFVVILHNVFAALPPASWATLFTVGAANLTFLLEGCGQVGVALFFCLSGYLMAKGFYCERYSASISGMGAFYRNRFLRIVPLYAFYIVIASTLGITHADSQVAFVTSIARLATFTYSAEFANASTILFSHLWTISTEVQFYLIVPIIMFVLLQIRPSPKVAVCGLATLFAGGAIVRTTVWHATGEDFGKWNQSIYEPMWMNLDLFVGGMLLNFIPRQSLRLSVGRHASAFTLSILLFYLVSAYATYEGLTMHVSTAAIDFFIIGVPSLTFAFAISMIYWAERMALTGSHPRWPSGAFFRTLKAVEFVGKITFGVYLWHVAFIYRDWPYIPASTPMQLYGSLLSTTICLTLLAATVTYYGVELTSDRLKARSSRRSFSGSVARG